MKRCAILTLVIVFGCLSSGISFSDEGSLTLCLERAYRLRYDDVLNKIIVGCYMDMWNTPFHIIDPYSLDIEETFHLNGCVGQVNGIDSGNKLLVSVGEYDGNRITKEGKLIEIDYSTGNITRELLHDQELVTMVIDSAEETAFIDTIGSRRDNNPSKILKVCLSTFQIVDEVVFGNFVRSIKLSSDDSKLYVQTQNVFPELSPRLSQFGVAVFDTADLSIIEQIVLDYPAGYLVMSDDGSQLFISSSVHRTAPDVVEGVSLYIVDTSTDEISEVFLFEHEGELVTLRTMALDSENNKLYAHASNQLASNLILELDLDDYSYSTFTMGDNPIGRIALAQTSNGPRLFATERGTPVVHYKDLE